MTDLVERLRAPMNRDEFFKVADGLCRDAADEITRLTAALEDAREDCRESEEARETMLVAASDFKAEALVARKTALEEAAKVADEVADEIFGRSGELAAWRIASRIRALVKP